MPRRSIAGAAFSIWFTFSSSVRRETRLFTRVSIGKDGFRKENFDAESCALERLKKSVNKNIRLNVRSLSVAFLKTSIGLLLISGMKDNMRSYFITLKIWHHN